MKNNELGERLSDTIKDFTLPGYSEIPDVGLFLEQTVKYINGYLNLMPNMELTGSMVSNYVKKGIIPSPVKKQYSREQISNLILIAIAKSVLTLDEVRSFMSLQREAYTPEMAYNYFATELMNMLVVVFCGADLVEELPAENSFAKIMLRNTVITVAHKVYLDIFFREAKKEWLDGE